MRANDHVGRDADDESYSERSDHSEVWPNTGRDVDDRSTLSPSTDHAVGRICVGLVAYLF